MKPSAASATVSTDSSVVGLYGLIVKASTMRVAASRTVVIHGLTTAPSVSRTHTGRRVWSIAHSLLRDSTCHSRVGRLAPKAS